MICLLLLLGATISTTEAKSHSNMEDLRNASQSTFDHFYMRNATLFVWRKCKPINLHMKKMNLALNMWFQNVKINKFKHVKTIKSVRFWRSCWVDTSTVFLNNLWGFLWSLLLEIRNLFSCDPYLICFFYSSFLLSWYFLQDSMEKQ